MFKTQVLFCVCSFYLNNPEAVTEDSVVVTKGGVGKPMKSLTPDEIEWLLKVG